MFFMLHSNIRLPLGQYFWKVQRATIVTEQKVVVFSLLISYLL